jgi:predicted acyl esterase
MRRCLLLGLLLALCGWLSETLTAPARAASAPTSLVMVPMRDGIRLATDIYLPAGDGPWPVVLARTPFGRAGFWSGVGSSGVPAATFLNRGLAVVVQETRGIGASEGISLYLLDEGWGGHPDGLDTVNWIRSQPWSSGKIATFGSSSVGYPQYLLAGTGPEGIIGQYVTGAMGNLYLCAYQNGVWHTTLGGWYKTNFPAAERLMRAHPHYDDFWRDVDLSARLDQVHSPMVHLTGWYDGSHQWIIDTFAQLQENGGGGARGRQHLVIGIWLHGDIYSGTLGRTAGIFTFPKNAVLPPETPTQLDWLSFWLTGQPAVPASEPAVRYYVMGDVTDPQAPGNVWRSADRWPPPSQPLRLYFTPDGRLDPQPPAAAATKEYDYDPIKPVPTLGGQEILMPLVGPQDQRRVEGRADVLVFTTPPLAAPLEVTGRISVHLNAASSARDTDFTAKLTDVYPNGRSIIITDGIVRARFRHSLEFEDLITPGQRYAYDIDLLSTSIIFNKGHQIRVAISSSNSPRFEPNRNTGGSLPYDPKQKAVVAHQTIFLGGTDGSCIVLPQVVGATGP